MHLSDCWVCTLVLNSSSFCFLQRYQDSPGVEHIPVVQIDLSVPLKVPGKRILWRISASFDKHPVYIPWSDLKAVVYGIVIQK